MIVYNFVRDSELTVGNIQKNFTCFCSSIEEAHTELQKSIWLQFDRWKSDLKSLEGEGHKQITDEELEYAQVHYGYQGTWNDYMTVLQ